MSSSSVGPPSPGDDGGDLSNVVIACTIVCLVVAAIAVAIRFYTRTVVVRALAAEDWFVLAAWVCGLVLDPDAANRLSDAVYVDRKQRWLDLTSVSGYMVRII